LRSCLTAQLKLKFCITLLGGTATLNRRGILPQTEQPGLSVYLSVTTEKAKAAKQMVTLFRMLTWVDEGTTY